MSPNQPSLLDGLENTPASTKRVRPKTIPWLRQNWNRLHHDRRARLTFGTCAGMLLLSGTIVGIASALPAARPDYGSDRIDTLFQYTLLTDEFNRLSVRERAELIGQLVERMGSMGSSDSVLLAAFASSINGTARDQLLENASKLFIDMIDEQALAYDPNLSKEEREQQLDASIAEMHRLFATMSGQNDEDMTDEERVAEAEAQAQRDLQNVKDGDFSARDAGQFFGTMNRVLGSRSSPQQTARGGRMLRDMTRRMRGQDIDSGKPTGG
jgi:hypothetical protein